jgi:CRISPR-associated protein Cas2
MMVVVSYDVSTTSKQGKRRLRRVARACVDFGQRVQNSVFECIVDPTQWTTLRLRLLAEFNVEEDSLRFYFMGAKWKDRVEHAGAKQTVDLEEPLIL